MRTTMKICDRADGVRGHFCIGRPCARRGLTELEFWEYYNKGEWSSAGQVFTDREACEELIRLLRRLPVN